MSELRRNPFTGEWTHYAENRKNRPYEFLHKIETKHQAACPFCEGNEDKTTPPLYQDHVDRSWSIRVFPNMFPAVCEGVAPALKDDFYQQSACEGFHEVLVDTPKHEETIDQFTVEHLEKVLSVLQERYLNMSSDKNIIYVQIFKNCGPSAGMSIRHSHWQIIGMPVLPQREEAMQGHMKEDNCLFCKMLAHERKMGIRIAAENQDFLAIAPYASRFPYELWICPIRHIASFAHVKKDEIKSLADILKDILPRVSALREDIGYNICMIDGEAEGEFHWHMQILPRIGGFAGFEYATGSYINSVLPERAAEYYQNRP